MTALSPSLLAADFSRLNDEIQKAEYAGAEYLHLDVMDGHFVPNLSFGVPVIASIRKCTGLLFDVHLMITHPLDYLEAFAKAGADYITFHLESESDPDQTIDRIHALGKKAGISIKPSTPAEALLPYLPKLELVLVMSVEPGFGGQSFLTSALPKISWLRAQAPQLHISVDGGINAETGQCCAQAGADILVAGSYLFHAKDPLQAARSLRF